jgi:hypothetical protein
MANTGIEVLYRRRDAPERRTLDADEIGAWVPSSTSRRCGRPS